MLLLPTMLAALSAAQASDEVTHHALERQPAHQLPSTTNDVPLVYQQTMQSGRFATLPSMEEGDELARVLMPKNQHLDLATAVAITVARHPDIARALANVSRSMAERKEASSVWIPQVDYSANLGPNMLSRGSQTGLNDNISGPSLRLQQLIWDFGKATGQIRYTKSIERQRSFQLEATADEIAELAAITFLDVEQQQRLADQAQAHIKSLSRLREQIRLRTAAGLSERSDLLLADVRLENAHGESIQTHTDLAVAKIQMANLIGSMPESFDDPALLIEAFPERDNMPRFDKLPAIAAANEASAAASARIGQARSQYMPRLGMEVGYTRNNYTYNDKNNAFTAMVTVTGNLYNAGTKHAVTAAVQDKQAAEAERDASILTLRGRALAAHEQLRGGHQRIARFKAQETQARHSSQIFFEEYKLGKRSLSDLLNSELEIHRAAYSRIIAEMDVMRARIQNEAVHGALRASLGAARHAPAPDKASPSASSSLKLRQLD